MTDRTGGDVVVDVLARSGVDVVFGIPSVHNLPIYDAIRRDGRIRAISARHEQGAVGAADGFARTTGRLGVCLTSTGPGAANAMGAQLEACVSSSPVLHLTGQIDSRFLGKHRGFIHEVPDQLAMMATLSKASHRPPSPGAIAATIAQAVVEAMTSPSRAGVGGDTDRFPVRVAGIGGGSGPTRGLARIGGARPRVARLPAQPRSSRDPGGPSFGQAVESPPPVRSKRCSCLCVAWVRDC